MGLDDNAMTIYIQAFCCFQFKPEDHSILFTLERIASHEMGEGPMRKVLVQEGRAKILLRVLWSVMTKENTLDKELDCILSTLTSITSKLSDHIPEMLQVNFLDLLLLRYLLQLNDNYVVDLPLLLPPISYRIFSLC